MWRCAFRPAIAGFRSRVRDARLCPARAGGLEGFTRGGSPMAPAGKGNRCSSAWLPHRPDAGGGLDFQPRRADTRDAQIEAFERVCAAAARPSAEFPRRIMSIHSSAAAAFYARRARTHRGALMLASASSHWFSGSQEVDSRNRVGMSLLRERAHAQNEARTCLCARNSRGRLLIETDFPASLSL